MSERFIVTYRVRSDAGSIRARAEGIAIEQSVEMPLAAIDDAAVLADIVGTVEDIADRGGGVFDVRVGLAVATVERDAAQLLNMAFGNTSLQPDVTLVGLEAPRVFVSGGFGAPRHGMAGLRGRVGAFGRALTGAAIKPQGLPVQRLADLVARFAAGGIDLIKDDHGLADQAFSPFAARVAACAAAARRAGHALYVPSLSGDLDALRAQARIAREEGLAAVMVAPMLAGLANVQALGRAFPDLALLAHPTLGGAARIAPEVLIGQIFPLVGADAVIFPNYGGRFGYSATRCRAIAEAARGVGALPVPAGGMTVARVPELLGFYGADVMLLIGGNLLLARDELAVASRRFADAVGAFRYAANRAAG